MIDEYIKNINFNVYQSASVNITRSWYDREVAFFYRLIIDISSAIRMSKNSEEISS